MERTSLIGLYQRDYRFIPKNPFDPKSGVDITQVYTELDIEDFWDNEIVGKQCLKVDFENLIQSLDEHRSPKRIYLEGKAGSGKTVYACKLVTDWCNAFSRKERKCYLSEFSICIPLSLHSVQPYTKLIELIHSVVGDKYSRIDTVGLEDYIINNQERVLIVMDGLDEYRDNCPMVDDIISKQALRNCTVVITSRPWKIQDKIGGRLIDRRARILGFSKDNCVIYAQKCFTQILGIEEEQAHIVSSELMHELSRKNLIELSKFPLILLFICYLWKYNNHLPRTETEIYVNVVKCLVGNHVAKKNILSNTRSALSMQQVDLVQQKDLFLTLGSIAYAGFKLKNTRDELVFDLDELKKSFDMNQIQESLKIGLLSEQRDFFVISTTSHLSFPHKSIQEFFTAYLFAHTDNAAHAQELQVKLEDINAAEGFENVLKFVVGISQSGETSQNILNTLAKRCLSVAAQCTPACKRYLGLFLRLINELKSTKFFILEVESVYISEYNCLKLLGTITCNKIHAIKIQNVNITAEDLSFLPGLGCSEINLVSVQMLPDSWMLFFDKLSGLQHVKKLTCSHCSGIKRLVLRQMLLSKEGWALFFKSLEDNNDLMCIEINSCTGFWGTGIEFPFLPALETISFCKCKMNPKKWSQLLLSLSNAPELQTLEIDACSGIYHHKIQMPSLKMIRIKRNNMRAEGWESFFGFFRTSSRPGTVIIENCKEIRDCLIEVSKMRAIDRRLILNSIKMPDVCWQVFFSSLRTCNDLEEIHVSHCTIDGHHFMTDSQVSDFLVLKKVKFSGVAMKNCNWQHFFSSLDKMPRLQIIDIEECLDFCGSRISNRQPLPALTSLLLKLNSLSEEDIAFLFITLENFPNLETLYISIIEIGESTYSYDDYIKLPLLPALKHLHLSGIQVDPLKREVFFASLCSAVNLEDIVIRGVTMTPNTWRYFFQCMFNMSRLQIIDIEECLDFCGSHIQMHPLPALTSLFLKLNILSEEDLRYLFASLSNVLNLETLHISIIGIGDTIHSLADDIKLPLLPALKHLHLSGIQVDPLKREVFFASLCDAVNLENVVIRGVTMTPNTWRYFFQCMCNMSRLQIIEIEECLDFCGSHIEIQPLPVLTSLFLKLNSLDEGDIGFLLASLSNVLNLETLYISIFGTGDTIYSYDDDIKLPLLPALKHLHLSGIQLDPLRGEVFLASLCDAVNLEKIVIRGVTMAQNGWRHFFQSLCNMLHLQVIEIEECLDFCGSHIEIQPLSALTSLRLKLHSLNEVDIGLMFASLFNVPNLETLYISILGIGDTIYSYDDDIKLPLLPALKHLHLSGIQVDPLKREVFITSLCNAVNLENIVIRGVTMAPNGWRFFFQCLCNMSRLQIIEIEECLDFCGSHIEIQPLPALTCLRLKLDSLNEEDIRFLFASLCNVVNLEMLYISVLKMGDGLYSCVGYTELPLLPVLKQLHLSGIQLGPRNWEMFFASLGNAVNLESILIEECSNLVTYAGVQIPPLHRLERLRFSNVTMLQNDWKICLLSVRQSILKVEILNCFVRTDRNSIVINSQGTLSEVKQQFFRNMEQHF